MVTYANAKPYVYSDFETYVSGVALPATEADLLSPAAPAGVNYEAAVVAGVELTVAGGPSGNTGTYVVLQSDFGDGVAGGAGWYDLAWCYMTATTNGTYYFLLAAGVGGANAFQQSRANGTAPASSGSNQCPLPGRFRFTGQTTLTGGTSPSVTAKILYRILGLR